MTIVINDVSEFLRNKSDVDVVCVGGIYFLPRATSIACFVHEATIAHDKSGGLIDKMEQRDILIDFVNYIPGYSTIGSLLDTILIVCYIPRLSDIRFHNLIFPL